MAENAGGIYYEVEFQTDELIKGQTQATNAAKKVGAEFEKLESKVDSYVKTQELLGRTINESGQVLNKNGKIVVGATERYQRLKDAVSNFGAQSERVNTQVTQTARAVNGGLNQALTNTSYQIQDMAVQLAGGQNLFLVMAQQIPQLLVGMGAFAAGVGAAVAVLGGLYMAFGQSATNAEKLEKAIEQVQAVMTIGADGVANYSDEMRRLAGLSENLAKLKLASTIAEQNKAISLSVTGIREALDDTRGSFDTYVDQIEKVLGAQVGTNGYAAAEKAFSKYSSVIRTFTADGDVDKLERSLVALSDAGAANTKTGRALISQTVDLIEKYRVGKVTIDALKDSTKDLGTITRETTDIFSQLTNSLIAEEKALIDGERAAFAYSLSTKELTDSQKTDLIARYDRIAALENEKSLMQDLDALFEQEAARSAAQDQQKTRSLTTQVQTIGLTPLEEIQKNYDDQLALLQEAKERDIQIKGTYAEREKQIEKDKVDAINRYNQQQAQNNMMLSQSSMNTLNALGAMFGNFAEIAAKGGEKSFKTYKKMAIAQSMISTFMAANNALATPAPFPVPQILAGSIAALGLANVAQIRGQQYAGARQFGGPVSAGKPYLVGENGPELMVPPTAGKVISNRDLTSGSQPIVNIYGVPDSLGQPSVTMDQVNGAIDIRFKQQASLIAQGRGDMAKGISQGFAVKKNGAN